MKSIYIQSYHSPVGELLLGAYDNQLCLCDWKHRQLRESIDHRIKSGLNANYEVKPAPVFDRAIKQLEEYFFEQRRDFDIPLLMIGSEFQQEVWRALVKIPYGKTLSYMDLSVQLKNPKAIRAVAAANGANAISIMVPCHRIIGSDGNLVGYAGGLPAKKKLLQLENALTQMQIDF